jgi:hypothetical protein
MLRISSGCPLSADSEKSIVQKKERLRIIEKAAKKEIFIILAIGPP